MSTQYLADLGQKFKGTVKFDFYGSHAGVESVGLDKSGVGFQLEIMPLGGTDED